MKKFLRQCIALMLFLLAAGALYVGVKIAFISTFINIAAIILGIFFLIIACGEIDRIHGFGAYSATTESNSESQPNNPPHPPHHNPPQPPLNTNNP